MKNYIIPNTSIQSVAMTAFLCVSFTDGESGHEQLAPDRRPMAN